MEGRDNKIGYLYEDFKFFYIKDKSKLDFDYHHHDFNKIVILLNGDLTYIIEGKNYVLQPFDILLVDQNQIHKPVINPDKVYERIIFWLKPEDTRILNCFNIANENKNPVLRLSRIDIENIKDLLLNIKSSTNSSDFCSDILTRSLFLQFMIYINRFFIDRKSTYLSNDITYDKTIDRVIEFIDKNIDTQLNIDTIANECFISKYYLMRKFKSIVGISIHNYILNKRAMLAKKLLFEDLSLGEISIRCGFNDYSTFVRAFKKIYGVSPSKYNSHFNEFDLNTSISLE